MATEEKPDPPGTVPPDQAPTPLPGEVPAAPQGETPAAPKDRPAAGYRKKLTGAAQTNALAGIAAQSRLRGTRIEAGEKKYSVGDQLQKSSKPPSKIGRAIKLVLILIVVIGIPGLIGASFFVRVGKKKEYTAAGRFWKMIKDTLKIGPPPAPPFSPVTHPNVETFDDILKGMHALGMEISGIEKGLGPREKPTPLDKETALALHKGLDAVAARISRMMTALEDLAVWMRRYGELKGEASDAYDKGIGSDGKKQDCAQLMIRGQPIPPGFAETAKDPGVVKYVEALRKLEMDRYNPVPLDEGQITGGQRDAQALMKKIRELRSRLPSRIMLGGEAPEEPGKEAALPPYDPRKFHPWARATAETWVRYRVSMAEGPVSYEDRIVKEVKEDAIVFAGQRASGDQLSDDPEREEKFVPGEVKVGADEKIKVGDIEIHCQVVQVGEEKRWVARAGRWTNRMVLKTEKGGKETVVAKLGEEALPFKERQYNCIAYEIGDLKVWAHEDVPGFVFKVKAGPMTREVVDFGAGLAARPPFPKAEMKPEEPKKEEPKPEPPKMEPPKEEPKKEEPKPEPPKEEPKKEEPPKPEPPKEEPKKEEPKPEPPKPEPPKEEPKKEEPPKEPPPKAADAVLEGAEKLVIDGSVIFKELVEAMQQLPDDPARLKALLRRQEEAVALFTRARETYLSVREKAPAEAKVDEKLGKVEKILARLQNYGERIKSKLR